MKREIRRVDPEKGIIQITTEDERFYAREVMGNLDFVPSVTWISSFYPKGVGFYKWLATKGWDQAEEIKMLAGERGSKIHAAISVLVAGGTVHLSDKFENPSTLVPEELTADEYEAVMSFCAWFEEFKPEVIAHDYTIWCERYRYAGTVDLKVRMEGKIWIIDIKTSPDIWPSQELQVSAYKFADKPCHKTAILQVGYRRNRKKYKFTPVKDQFSMFLAVRRIWEKETDGARPLQLDFPERLSLNCREAFRNPYGAKESTNAAE